ncbi:MAG TPA: hypothetical protein VFL51_00730 [Pseudolabrys sp.]|nr:hypothetical protein [Pseudolabrys sp.]
MRLLRTAVIIAAVAAVPLAQAAAQSDPDKHLSPEQQAAKKYKQVNQAYEETIKNTTPLHKEAPLNDPWANMRAPASNTARR